MLHASSAIAAISAVTKYSVIARILHVIAGLLVLVTILALRITGRVGVDRATAVQASVRTIAEQAIVAFAVQVKAGVQVFPT